MPSTLRAAGWPLGVHGLHVGCRIEPPPHQKPMQQSGSPLEGHVPSAGGGIWHFLTHMPSSLHWPLQQSSACRHPRSPFCMQLGAS